MNVKLFRTFRVSSAVQPASSKDFRRGVGRARTLMRQAFGDWPGVAVTWAQSTVQWHSWSNDGRTFRPVSIDRLRLRQMEQTLCGLMHYHRDHLEHLLPNASDWIDRASNCLELLKEILHKPPSSQPTWSAIVDKMRIATRWKQRIFDLAHRWPKLQPLLWHLCFLELTSKESGRLACLPWLETQAESMDSIVHRSDGVPVALMLLQVGPHVDERWLRTIFALLSDETLGSTPCQASFAHADDLAQALRDRLKGESVKMPKRREALTMAEKLISQLWYFLGMKTGAINKITNLLGAVVGDDLGSLVHLLNSRAKLAEKRLQGELRKVGQLGVQYYVESVGLQSAIAGARVNATHREEGQALVDLFGLAKSLREDDRIAGKVAAAIEFFELAAPLKVACRIRLAQQWHECGWQEIGKFLPAVNELISRRGMHIELVKHWLRRLLPGVAERNCDLIATGMRHTNAASRQRAIQLIERLVYDLGERINDRDIVAIIKLAVFIPSLDAAVAIYRKIDSQVIASARLDMLAQAYWIAPEPNDFRMALAWLNLHPQVATQTCLLQWACKRPEHMDLLRRLLIKRDHAAIGRWSECVQQLESLNVSLPDLAESATSPEWMEQYPAVFHLSLHRLAQTCSRAEYVAADILGSDCTSSLQLVSEIDGLKQLLSNPDWTKQQTHERLSRIGKRIENLQQRVAEPHVLSSQRTAHLIDKLNERIDREMLASIFQFTKQSLLKSYGDLNVAGLRERLQQSPYDRILPALRKLRLDQQEIAWRALRSSWDNSLKLQGEPANARFLMQMQNKGLTLDAWLSSDLWLEGMRQDGAPYRVAFTQDPFDILLMGHHFDTCLALDGFNFHSTVANLVDANKRVLYGRTASGQVVGRCLFALTNQGQLQTFHRYQHCAEDGFEQLVDEFAERLVQLLGTSQTESGQVSCLVSRTWYDDGCVPVPNSPRGKSHRLEELLAAQPEADAYELALQVFGSDDELIQAAGSLYEWGLFNELRVVRSLFPKLVHGRNIAVSLRLRLASMIWAGGDKELARSVFQGLPGRDIWRSLGRNTLSELNQDRNFVDLIANQDRALARRLFHRGREKKAVGRRQ